MKYRLFASRLLGRHVNVWWEREKGNRGRRERGEKKRERKRDGEIRKAVKKSLSGKQFSLSELCSHHSADEAEPNLINDSNIKSAYVCVCVCVCVCVYVWGGDFSIHSQCGACPIHKYHSEQNLHCNAAIDTLHVWDSTLWFFTKGLSVMGGLCRNWHATLLAAF